MQIEKGKTLSELIAVININMKNFYKIGIALKEIRDKRLYRENNDTFEGFCRNHLTISRVYAYRQIVAAEVISNLLPIGNMPLNESQVRPLTKLKSSEQKLAWKCATDIANAENRKVKSQDVSNAVNIITGKKSLCINDHNKREKSNRKSLEKIDLVSIEFKKAYELFFEAIKNDMNNDWKRTSKDVVLNRLQALVKFLKNV